LSTPTPTARHREDAAPLTPAQVAECQRWIREHSRSFYMASWLLPASVREASWALYAFCRRTDDAVDDGASVDEKGRRLVALGNRLARVYPGGGPAVAGAAGLDGVDQAYAAVAARYGLPRALPAELIAGMQMDAEGQRYRTMDDLYLYCFRVASSVGLMMTLVMGASRDDAYARAAELGVAMQLTNIARDVGEDARRGRVYLPDDLLEACGTSADRVLGAAEATWAIRNAVRLLLEHAGAFYSSSRRGIPLLPRSCRPAIAAAGSIYGAIGDEIALAGYDSITRRAHTSGARKAALAVASLPAATTRAAAPGSGPIDPLLTRWLEGCGVPTGTLAQEPPRAAHRRGEGQA
jgi:15-cis-phytoene synthase